MSRIVCHTNCPYNSGMFCVKEFLSLNAAGQCKVWWNDQGSPRQVPWIPPEPRPMEESEQPLPQENIEEKEKENIEEKTEEVEEEIKGEVKMGEKDDD